MCCGLDCSLASDAWPQDLLGFPGCQALDKLQLCSLEALSKGGSRVISPITLWEPQKKASFQINRQKSSFGFGLGVGKQMLVFLRGAESGTLNGMGSGGQKNGSDELGRAQNS